jgi:type I restriction enzyme R subunit
MVEHFHEQVIAKGKVGGRARAMVVTGSIERAIEYYYAICRCLEARKSSYKVIAAFSGDKEYQGKTLNEAAINGFPSNQIEKTFRQEPYRFLVGADKFQTGYDEPLLHTMYVDKILTDIKAVQTLSRLNRARTSRMSRTIFRKRFLLTTARQSCLVKQTRTSCMTSLRKWSNIRCTLNITLKS